MRGATKYANSVSQLDNNAALEAIKKSGKTTVYALSDKEKAEWRKALQPVHKEMAGRIGKDLIDAVYKESAALGYK